MNLFTKYGILSAAEEGIFLSGWNYGKKITIPESQIDADLTNFPMTVYLSSTNFDFSKCKADGADIRFTDKNLNLLKFERKEHSNVNQKAVYNVLIPAISGTTDTEFYMWYGNSGVYNASIESWQDQTGKQLTYNGNVKLAHNATHGRRMATLDGSGDYFSLPNNIKDFNFLHQVGTIGKWTAEFKYKANSFTSDAYFFDTIRATPTNHGVYFAVFADRKIYASISNGASQWVVSLISTAGAFPNDFDLHTIKITYDQSLAANNCKVYIDGALVSQATKTGNAPSTSDCLVPYIGIYNTSYNTTNGCIAGIRFTNGRCRDAEATPVQFDIDGTDVVFCTNFDTVYDQNYAMVQHMGDSLVDATGNGNNGTATGTAVVNTEYGKARSFNGTSDHILVGANMNWTGDTTMIAQAISSDFSSDRVIFVKGSDYPSSAWGAKICTASTYNTLATIITTSPSTSQYTIKGTSILNTTDSVIVGGRFDNTAKQIKVYTNGIGEGAIATGSVLRNNASCESVIGADRTGASTFVARFSGKIYEVRVSSFLRSDAWIKAESFALKNQLLAMEAA